VQTKEQQDKAEFAHS